MRLALAVAFLIVTAGCLSSSRGPDPESNDATGDEGATPGDGEQGTPGGGFAGEETDPAAATSIPWELHDCSFYYATTQADAAKVREHLPEGFTIPDGQVAVAYEFNECQNGTGMSLLIGPLAYASVWVGATPPGGGTNGVFSVVGFDVLIPDAERRDWLQAHGVAAHDGGIKAVSITSAAGVQRVKLTYGMDDVGDFTLEYAGPQSTPDAGGTFDQWTGDQLVYWKTDWQTTEHFTATGTVTLPPASIYADWYPAATVPATVTLGTWDYTNGSISL